MFSRTKHGAKKIAQSVRDMRYTASEIHANRSLAQRREALEGFRNGKYRVLIATDIAARGIDVKGISLVLNYDLPDNAEDYVHRIGRTGRAGQEGHAISFATPDQQQDIRAIERLIRGTPAPQGARHDNWRGTSSQRVGLSRRTWTARLRSFQRIKLTRWLRRRSSPKWPTRRRRSPVAPRQQQPQLAATLPHRNVPQHQHARRPSHRTTTAFALTTKTPHPPTATTPKPVNSLAVVVSVVVAKSHFR